MVWKIVITVVIFLGGSYLLSISGLWLPAIAPLIVVLLGSLTVLGYYYQNQQRIAFTDGLTKIANRRRFDRFFAQQWSKCQGDSKDLAIILCDVDFFGTYSDTYGRQSGDVCLQKVALTMDSSVRGDDLAARYGEAEFIVVLPDSNTKTALLVADRIRSRLRSVAIPHPDSAASPYISLSMGIASLDHNRVISPAKLLTAANQALDQAKKAGRDRAIISNSVSNP